MPTFEANFRASAKTSGVPDVPYVIVAERALPLFADSEIHRRVDPLVDTIADKLINSVLSEGESRPRETISLATSLFGQEAPEREAFEGADQLEAWENMNAAFLERQWGDGFPLVAPTPDAVARMLAGTRRSPEEVVAVLEPCSGIATVEKIAINCVMAGCKPEALPVLIAAVEAITDPRYQLTHVATSTTAYTPMLVVNGPITKRIGMNSGYCCLGPGAPSAVNTTIGRALRLIMMNISGNYVGVTDLDTIGDPNKYSMCLAEREEENPWEPLHVERGFDKDESTVTAFVASASIGHADHWNTQPDQFLRRLAQTICNPAVSATLRWTGRPDNDTATDQLKPGDYEHDCLIILCPNHALKLAESGWSKQGIKEVLHHLAVMRIGDGPGARGNMILKWDEGENARILPEWQWLHDYPDMELPVYRSPENYHFVVAGADTAKSMVVFGGMKSITRRIEE